MYTSAFIGNECFMEVNNMAEKTHANSVEKCSVCELKKNKGIHILNLYVCEDCEREIVVSDVSDEFYKYYLQKVKRINESLINIS